MNEPFQVQISRFSFFSREAILAFAPCSTASTRAIESVQRKPNGGTSSSTENAHGADRKKAIRPNRRIRHVAGRLELAVRFSCRLVISGCIGCIFCSESDSSWHSGAGKIARAGHSGQLRSAAQGAISDGSSPRRLPIGGGHACAEVGPERPFCFSLAHARFSFLVKKFFVDFEK